MSGPSEFANWFSASFALALLIPIALAVGLYFILRRTFRLSTVWSAAISIAVVAAICAILFA